jgi:hypothetical protein
MERTAHHGNPRVPLAERGPQQPPHRSLPPVVFHHIRMVGGPFIGGTDLGNCVRERREPLNGVAVAVLDGVLPPAFGVAVSGGACKDTDGVRPVGA